MFDFTLFFIFFKKLSNKNLGCVWFSFLKLDFLKKLSFQKVHNKKVFFQKAEVVFGLYF